MNTIYVYRDKGASGISAQNFKFSLSMALQNWDIDVQFISAEEIKQGHLLNVNRVSMLTICGGRFTETKEALGEKGITNIQNFVKDGGGYCGICMGAYGAFADIEFNGKVPLTGQGIGIFNTKASGHLPITPPYDGTAHTATIIQLQHHLHNVRFPSAYWGGFNVVKSDVKALGATPLSTYNMPDGTDRVMSFKVNRQSEGNPIVLNGHHFEASNRLMIWKWLTTQGSSKENNIRLKQEIEAHDPQSYLMGLACGLDDMQCVPHHSFVQALLNERQDYHANTEKPVAFPQQAFPLIN